MINLLPPEEKQKIFQEKRKKLAIIFGIIIVASLFSFSLILLSVKFSVAAEANSEKVVLKQAKKTSQTKEFLDLNNTIKKYNTTLSRANSFYNSQVFFNQAMEILLNIPKPEGVVFTNFLLNRGDNGVIQFGVSGISQTRDELLEFRKNIEASEKIKNPAFSAESWIAPKNAKFSLIFQIEKNENQN